MPSLRADPTTDHAADATATLGMSATTTEASAPTTDHERSAPTSSSAPPPVAAGELKHERFRIGEKLGEGGMGVVYRARDARDGREVALKLMKSTLEGSARRRFEREFHSLSAMRHPHCLRVYDYGELAGGPFFTMELFEGRPITSISHAREGVGAALDSLRQLTLALDYIHDHGIVHRDVKPSNILVRPAEGADGAAGHEVKLMDFGLAKFYGAESPMAAEAGFAGTLSYCAPEQLNLDELDHRADLYCLGLVGYEVLGGRYAFPEARLAGMRPLMQAQLAEQPRPLAEVNPEVPSTVADAVMEYLLKEPRRRPESGGRLRSAIAACLGLDEKAAVRGVAIPSARPALSVTGFVCRGAERALLAEILRRRLSPDASGDEIPAPVIVVAGEPGIGKSSVVREAERLARGHGCQVLRGRCFDGNLSPFQPFVEIIRQLIAGLGSPDRDGADAAGEVDVTTTRAGALPMDSAARLLAVVRAHRGELLRIAPELRKYLPGAAYRQVEYGQELDYIHRALSAFFLEVAAVQPICLSFEDLQWADKSSMDLLRSLAAALAGASRSEGVPGLMIVASARTGYAPLEAALAPMRERGHLHELPIAPLVDPEARELIALRLNCRPEELADDLVGRVQALCRGNPFFIAETVREWYEKQAIARVEGAWALGTLSSDATDLPETIRDVMWLRLQGLDPRARRVLGPASVIGAVVDMDLLGEAVTDLGESGVLDAVDLLIAGRVFRETGDAGRVEFAHDLLREMTYAELAAPDRRDLHGRVGGLLESRRAKGQAVAAAVLADHFKNADDRQRAFAYAMEAAQAALDAYAFNNAIAHLNDALRLCPDVADDATRYRIQDMLATALGSSGRLDEAIGAYREALGHAGDPVARARVYYGIGEAYHRKGDYDEAVRHLDAALVEVGSRRRQGLAGRLLDMCQSSLAFHMIPSALRLPGDGPEKQRRIEIAHQTWYRLCQISSQRDLLGYIQCSYKLAAISKRSKNPETRAVGYAKLAINCAAFSMGAFGAVFLRRARRAVESSRPEVQAMVQAHMGFGEYLSGRLDAAEANLRESVALLDKVGDWLGLFNHHFLRHVYAVRGDIPRELAEAETEIAMGTARGDPDAIAWGWYGKADALARAGRIDEAQRLTTRAIESMTARKSLVLAIPYGTLGFIRLQASDYPGARAALEQSRAIIKRTFYLIEFVAPTFPLLVESLLGPRWMDSEARGGPLPALARKASREGRFARFIGRRYPNYGPHALRVSGRAAFALGKTKQAARYLERSIAAADALGARYDLARAWLDASLVIPDKADEYRRRGQQLLDELGAVVPEAERLPLTAAGHP